MNIEILPETVDLELGNGTLEFQLVNFDAPLALSRVIFNDLDCAWKAATILKWKRFAIIRIEPRAKFGVKTVVEV